MNRKLVLLILALLAVVLQSCEEMGSSQIQYISVEPSEVNFSSEGGVQTVRLQTNAKSWTLSGAENSEWCRTDIASGKSSSSITVTVAPNEEESERTCVLTFSAKNAKDAALTVKQAAMFAAGGADLAKLPLGVSIYPEDADADMEATIYFKARTSSPLYGYSGDVYAHLGIVYEEDWMFVPAEWTENIDKCRMTRVSNDVWAIALRPTIRDFFCSGETPVNSIGVVVRNEDGTKKGIEEDSFISVTDNRYVYVPFVPDEVIKEPMPAGMQYGINCNADNSVTFVLYDKDTEGGCHDYCYLIGEFNGWERVGEYAMKRDDAAGCWWITLSGLDAGREYMFQYHLGSGDTNIRLCDPYTEIVYDPWNDQYIPSSTYPALRAYPSGTKDLVSAFQINRLSYSWQCPSFRIDDPDDLIIYELHFRDFSSTGDINGAMEKLDYLEALGVDAIELMPVQEFDGNDSWGYNPNSYFALDKAYGTREKYKEFIDECHLRGIAVLLDVVYNQATGSCPLAKLYWDSAADKTAPENPWFNVDALHPYSVFHDWNHESQLTREYIKRNLEYLLTEYKVDGFRFDLTKGFTNKASTESTASNYDASRIAILKDYYSHIVQVNPDAVVILEHFCADSEERELAAAGMKVWRNLNNAYCQSAMGFSSDSSFSGLWTGSNNMPFGCYVGYMESHDEERTAYKSEAYGASGVKGNLEARMCREALNAAFFLTVPGPKMIWQFGELGYDVSLEENGRTGRKPLHWEYYDDSTRKTLYDTYCNLIGFRHDNPEFFSETASFSWNVGASAWASGRSIICTAGSKSFAVVGNFDTASRTVSVELPSGGQWSNYFDRSETYSGNSVSIGLQAGEYRLLVNF